MPMDQVRSRQTAPQYTWLCQHCGRSSPGGAVSCANCGFPAHASAFELERVKQLGSVPAFLAERQAQRDNWRRTPLLRKILLVVALILFLVGLILFRFAFGSFIVGEALRRSTS